MNNINWETSQLFIESRTAPTDSWLRTINEDAMMPRTDFQKNWKEIVSGFLKLRATAYGGPAIYGILQTELQEKRHLLLWM